MLDLKSLEQGGQRHQVHSLMYGCSAHRRMMFISFRVACRISFICEAEYRKVKHGRKGAFSRVFDEHWESDHFVPSYTGALSVPHSLTPQRSCVLQTVPHGMTGMNFFSTRTVAGMEETQR